MGRDRERIDKEVVDWTEFEKWAKVSKPLSSIEKQTLLRSIRDVIMKYMKKES